MEDLFARYVVSRSYTEPGVDGRKVILSNDPLLAELAGLWRNHRDAFEALLRARINPIQQELIGEAVPYEVPILRQAMIEVAFIGDDLEEYAREYERRKKDGLIEEGVVVGQEGSSPPATDNGPDNGEATSSM